MRILHTADWHLGQRFKGYDRHDEHQCFLDWLLEAIEEAQVEAVVVAGDVFDVANPSATAQKQYYTFLARLGKSRCCRDVVIVGGNHDNPHLLNAPGAILKALNIHIVGTAAAEAADQCIPLPTGSNPRLVVAAVPFLRDADIRKSAFGESGEEQDSRIRQGIAEHYSRVAACTRHHRAAGVPVMATGHLFAQGCAASEESERTIHVGNLGQVAAEAFTDTFDYVALGHLHRHQTVGGHEHIRYSGSPIPLSFSEDGYGHRVLLLDFEGAQHPRITPLAVPCTRRLLRIRGSLAEVMEKLQAWTNEGFRHPAWADVTVVGEDSAIQANDKLHALHISLCETVAIVNHRVLGRAAVERPGESEGRAAPDADMLREPARVFARLLDVKGIADNSPQRETLLSAFAELLSLDEILEVK